VIAGREGFVFERGDENFPKLDIGDCYTTSLMYLKTETYSL
jgi:hypothetical protein